MTKVLDYNYLHSKSISNLKLCPLTHWLTRVKYRDAGASKKNRLWQDLNLQSPDPKSNALSIRPHGLMCLVNITNHSCFLPIIACCNDMQTKTTLHIYIKKLSWNWNGKVRSCGPMDKASDYKSGDRRFESCQDQHFVQANICISPTMHVLHRFVSEWWGTNVCLINHRYQCVLINIKACVVECEILQSAHVLRNPLSRLHFPNSMCDNTVTRFWGENAH